MRVIAGSAKGTRLYGVRGRRVRPVLDRVKESMFGLLGDAVLDARVLDLFAGVGCLGIEALSRGAEHVDFIESHRATADCIRANLERAHLSERARVHVARLPGGLSRVKGPFGLIFADPPFRIDARLLDEFFRRIDVKGQLGPHGLLVYRRPPDRGYEPPGERWTRVERRSYGDSVVAIYRLEGRAVAPPEDKH